MKTIKLLLIILFLPLFSQAEIIGHIDSANVFNNGDIKINGWACDRGVQKPIKIHLYLGGGAGIGNIYNAYTANNHNEHAVSSLCETSGVNHRFEIFIPNEDVRTNQGKSIYIHGISEVDGDNLLISRSGLFNLSLKQGVSGYIDSVKQLNDGKVNIRGWACDIGLNESILVNLYLNGASGTGRLYNSYEANLHNEDAVSHACNTKSVNHRFEIVIPKNDAEKNKDKSIYIHAISKTNGENLLIERSGQLTIPTSLVTKPEEPSFPNQEPTKINCQQIVNSTQSYYQCNGRRVTQTFNMNIRPFIRDFRVIGTKAIWNYGEKYYISEPLEKEINIKLLTHSKSISDINILNNIVIWLNTEGDYRHYYYKSLDSKNDSNEKLSNYSTFLLSENNLLISGDYIIWKKYPAKLPMNKGTPISYHSRKILPNGTLSEKVNNITHYATSYDANDFRILGDVAIWENTPKLDGSLIYRDSFYSYSRLDGSGRIILNNMHGKKFHGVYNGSRGIWSREGLKKEYYVSCLNKYDNINPVHIVTLPKLDYSFRLTSDKAIWSGGSIYLGSCS